MFLICLLSGILSFTTLPAVGDDEDISYAVIGDLGTSHVRTIVKKNAEENFVLEGRKFGKCHETLQW